jgi:hypothetical protein
MSLAAMSSPGRRLLTFVARTAGLLTASAFAGNLAEAPRTYAAERIAAGIEPVQLNGVAGHPGMAIRAVKVNLPWMSYRVHEFYRRNEATCRDLDYWKALIDHLAESRFNRLSLWSLHPYQTRISFCCAGAGRPLSASTSG